MAIGINFDDDLADKSGYDSLNDARVRRYDEDNNPWETMDSNAKLLEAERILKRILNGNCPPGYINQMIRDYFNYKTTKKLKKKASRK